MSSGAADRLAVLSALSQVAADLPRLATVLADADDDDAAVGLLREAYSFTDVQARAVLDAPVRLLTRGRREALDVELRDVRDALAAPWDPPIEVQATVHSPRRVELVIDGVEHRVEGADLDDCLGRVASLVRDSLSRPQRRRVAVSTGLTDGPTRILVDPLGGTTFVYADDLPAD